MERIARLAKGLAESAQEGEKRIKSWLRSLEEEAALGDKEAQAELDKYYAKLDQEITDEIDEKLEMKRRDDAERNDALRGERR